ncbi:Secretion protein HlyD family protein [Crenothrix polyspora]|uniref:Secretion protein HlyD family protein n=1 Tax=Crenothrix polyspora TaxID=360316 RepID=A0A1R4HAF5_9GAMM|nr:biotin/lipoyl-binding protein [Crenothrix polyspora]SJM93244.1 Secretion protein HlyD family protein [Crenothrix polyspora]
MVATALQADKEKAPPWPTLRDDLAIFSGPKSHDGLPTWTLHDPLAHRYFRLGWLEFECLQRWAIANPEQIAIAIEDETPLEADVNDVEQFCLFLNNQQLTKANGVETSRRFAQQLKAGKTGFWVWLLHNYLFMRIPLLKIDPYLKKVVPWLSWLFKKQFIVVLAVFSCLALYLVTQQWSQFTHSFLYVLTPEGVLATACMLSLSKVVHEFGHAFAASHFGCRVPMMGVALLLGMPVLWTDVTDAWRLSDRKQRLTIDAAGMIAELTLAVFATILWTMLPDGPFRSGIYLLASTAWVLTLAVNLNPFMRFDGYYLLADGLDIANLQDRSFALARWRLRESLFGFGHPAPERWSTGRYRLLLAYAYGTWIYRLILFTGIAWAVYYFFFKVLGLALFAVEMGWFVIRPMLKEMSAWREQIAAHDKPIRPRVAWLVPIAALAVLFVPWQSHLIVPGLLHAQAQSTLYSPQPAQVKKLWVHEGDTVKAGQILMELTSPDLDFKIATAQREWAELSDQLASQSLELSLARRNPIDAEAMQSALAELEGLRAAHKKLTVKSAFPGRIRDLSDVLRPGEWLAKDEVLGDVETPVSTVVAYAEEADVGRLETDGAGRFYPEGGDLLPFGVRILTIDKTGTRQLNLEELASTHGGAIAVRPDAERRLVPEQGIYRVLLQVENSEAKLPMTVRGRLSLETPPESLVERVLRSAAAVVIRESGW